MTEDLVVIGSGPGGYVAAVLASKEGLDVKVIEKGVTGGVCTNYGCIPSKALLSISGKIEDIKGAKRDGIDVSFEGVDFKKVMSKKERAVKMSRKGIEKLFDENGIELIEGEAKVVSEDEVEVNGERLKADNIIIATGSKPISLPDIEIDEEKILSNRGILDLDEAPETLLVIGGGYIGLEMAYVYSSLGSEVIIVELLDELLPNMDKDLSSVAEKMMKRKKVQFYTGSKVTEITEREEDLKVMIEGEEEKSLEVDKVLLSVGRKPTPPPSEIELTDDKGTIEIDEKMRTDFDGIYAIGDVNGESMLAHSAFKEAEIAVKDILGKETEGFDPLFVPAGVYTHPEMASVGFTEIKAKERFDDVKVGTFPISATGRGSSTGERMGLAKVIGDPEGEILGVHLACPGATDIIMEASAAIEAGMSVKELGELIHPHPTYSEAIKEAAENVLGESVHS